MHCRVVALQSRTHCRVVRIVESSYYRVVCIADLIRNISTAASYSFHYSKLDTFIYPFIYCYGPNCHCRGHRHSTESYWEHTQTATAVVIATTVVVTTTTVFVIVFVSAVATTAAAACSM
jgi:hypothetical protein